jgi:hypothetical protein
LGVGRWALSVSFIHAEVEKEHEREQGQEQSDATYQQKITAPHARERREGRLFPPEQS